MRLLYVHDQFGALAGAEANVLASAGELKLRGHDLGLLHGPGTGRGEESWRETFPSRFSLGADAESDLDLAIRGFRPDVVFLHKLSDLSLVERLGSCGVPVVRMVHDHEMYCMKGYKYGTFSRNICTRPASAYCVFPCGGCVGRSAGGRWPLRWIRYTEKRREIDLNRRFDRLLVASSYMQAELLRNGFHSGQIEIHAPVPRNSPVNCLPSFSPENRIVYAGQIVRGKGVDVLLEALALVRSPFECLILGDGRHRPACEALSKRLGLDGRVKFEGFVPQAQVTEAYRNASLAVMSSVWPEPFGAVGLEAMRCGLPVVAFDAGGISEWLIDAVNGYLVPWMDRARFAARVDSLLCDKARARQMGANGRRWADERFNFSRYISGLEDLFARVSASQSIAMAS